MILDSKLKLTAVSRWRTTVLFVSILTLGALVIFGEISPSVNNTRRRVIDVAEIERELGNHTSGDSPTLKRFLRKLPRRLQARILQEQQQSFASYYKTLVYNRTMKYHEVWNWAAEAIGTDELFPEDAKVDEVLRALQTAKIVNVDILDIGKYESGTAEKLVVVLEGGQKAMMKIVWENKHNEKLDGRCNLGFEMPTSEIAAFHLHRVLGFRNTPYVTGRKIDLLREVLPVASPRVAEKIARQGNRTCVVGKCLFCPNKYTLCPDDGKVEASLSYWVPRHLKLFTQPPLYKPYSYKHRKHFGASGFNDKTYCNYTRKNHPPYHILQYYHDLFDFAIMDTLMYHYDSKHYIIDDNSRAQNLTIKLDHGRSFCFTERDDEHLFLAPVIQCCTLRNSTWQKLQAAKEGALGQKLQEALNSDPLAPVLADHWFPVLDRRLKVIFNTIERCAEANGWENVIV